MACQREFAAITNTHLKSHALTISSYKKLYPGAELVDEAEKLRASMHAKLHNKPGMKRPTVGAKIKETKTLRKAQGVDYGKALRGKAKSKEHKLKLAETVKKAYESGKRAHWAVGVSVSLETKEKISRSLATFFEPQVKARAEHEAKLKALSLAQREAKRLKYEKLLSADLQSNNLALKTINEANALFSCLTCSYEWTLTTQYLDQSKRAKIKCRQCNPKLTTSIIEGELFAFVKGLCVDAVQSDRSVLGGRELDVLVPSKRIAFEMNGLYWHSELVRGSPKHMLWKQQHAYKLGYRLYHIFEDEWLYKQEIVKSRIKAILGKLDIKLDARKLKLCKLSNVEKSSFLTANHLQGDDVAGIRYGLKAEDGALVACATFKRTSYVKGGTGTDYELSRLATLSGCSVRGAASKLVKAFSSEHEPGCLISYADRRWSFGGLYESLGFKFESFSPPSYWYMHGYKDRKHRASFMKHELVKQGHSTNKTEWEIMQELGYDRIWDCGTLKYKML
jgi:hypothetical protein